jgi:two-component sensor histidine kinase
MGLDRAVAAMKGNDMFMPDACGSTGAMNECPQDKHTAATKRVEFKPERSPGHDRAPISPRAGKLLATLLPPDILNSGPGCAVLRPLWADEAMHRSYNLVRLTMSLERRSPLSPGDNLSRDVELALAVGITEVYRTLAAAPERQVMTCSSLLRELVVDLIALFGPIVGWVELTTDIECVGLAGFQQRALILAASELVMNALFHAFQGRRRGRLAVKLRSDDSRHACLTVSDDGIGYDGDQSALGCGVAAGLADLLASTIVYRRGDCGGTIALIHFPLDIQEPSRPPGREDVMEHQVRFRAGGAGPDSVHVPGRSNERVDNPRQDVGRNYGGPVEARRRHGSLPTSDGK